MIGYFISIIFHVVILHDYRFFWEIPRFEELQDSNSSPRREEVGRPTLGAFGGFPAAFFYREKFRVFTQQILLAVDEPRKLGSTSLQPPRGVEESNSPSRMQGSKGPSSKGSAGSMESELGGTPLGGDPVKEGEPRLGGGSRFIAVRQPVSRPPANQPPDR